MKLNLSLILLLLSIVCYAQTSGNKICISQKHADSIANTIVRYNQLKVVHQAQNIELAVAYQTIDNQVVEINELDSLNTDNVDYYETVDIPRRKRTARILGATASVETLLIVLLILL